MKDRPDILLITADQQRADCFGFEGRRVKTPHLDELAREGTRFSASITPNVVCQPARASMLTGLLPHTHGVVDNGFDLPDHIAGNGFAGLLSRTGYRTGFIGKAHFTTVDTFRPTGAPECRRSMQDYDQHWSGPYMGFQHVELVVCGHNRRPPTKPPGGQHYEYWYYADGKGDAKNVLHRTKLPPDVGALQTWHSALPPAWHNSTWVGDRTIEFLKQDLTQPFCLWASFPDPHAPFDCPEPWSRLHDPEEIDLPPHRVLDLERRPWWHEASLRSPNHFADPGAYVDPRLSEGDSGIGYSRLAPQSELHLRHTIANYYGMISLIDHNVGRILTALGDLGIADNTLVVYTSDHGDWLGDHGLIQKGPVIYDGLLKVGLLMKGPGIPRGRVIDEPVSTLDLTATFSDYAGQARAGHGRSLRPLVERSDETRDFTYHEWDLEQFRYGVGSPLSLRTVRTKTHKLTLELSSGVGELYDLGNDPHEMDNLFEDAGRSKVRKELEGMIKSRPQDELDPPLVRVGL